MDNLISELGSKIKIEDFENALRRHANNNAETLGQLEYWNEIIDSFVSKAETIIEYESEK